MPPIWEYLTAGGYRAPGAVTADLARVTRFAAINLLFTSSPLYPPDLSPLRLPGSINLDIDTYEGWKGVDASQDIPEPALLLDELTELHRVPYTSDQQDLAFKQGARNCYQLWLNDNACYPNRPFPRSRICFSTAPSPSARHGTGAGITRACCSTTSPRTIATRDSWVSRRQLGRRYAERRLQLPVTCHHGAGVWADDDADP